MSLVSAAIVAALSHFARPSPAEPPEAASRASPAALAAPPPRWERLAASSPLYALEVAEIQGAATWGARRHVAGGREDTMLAGDLDGSVHLRLAILRGLPDPGPTSFYVDVVRRAAEAGLSVTRSGRGAPLDTKFGPVEVASVILDDGAEHACLAFRFRHAEISFGLQGWLCGSAAQPATEHQLACFVDRLALLRSDDPALRVVFAQAARRRTEACAKGPRPQTAQAAPPSYGGPAEPVRRPSAQAPGAPRPVPRLGTFASDRL